jgi:preprotein translocase subunit SecD
VSVRRNVVFLVLTLVVVIGTFVYTVASDHTPVLGLDLQGGTSVVLSPVGKFKSDTLDVAIDIIRNRVDTFGTLEPEITRQGSDIVIDLPGVKDRDKAIALVGKTAELRFRPVISALPSEVQQAAAAATTTTTAPGATPTAKPSEAEAREAIATCNDAVVSTLTTIPTTTSADDQRDSCVVLPDKPGDKTSQRYYLGKAALTGKGTVDTAKAEFVSGQGWTVKMDLTDSGSSKWDQLAEQQFHKQVAIVLDGLVQSAPTIQPQDASFTSFGGTAVISGSFTQDEADNLAKLIRFGALPVVLKQVNVENVSPTLGNDQLHAGILAGIIGLALVAIYMLVFYRVLGLVVIAGVLLSGMALYSLIAWILPDVLGITIVLSLAGVTGIIVSVGVTVDSYIVYYERMKDEVRAGATVRSCVDRSFTRSFRTILAADLVSLIGALVLYILAIGSVRGFALFLAISTILDLVVAYFFMHPVVSLMARRPHLVRMKGIGIAAGLDAHENDPPVEQGRPKTDAKAGTSAGVSS